MFSELFILDRWLCDPDTIILARVYHSKCLSIHSFYCENVAPVRGKNNERKSVPMTTFMNIFLEKWLHTCKTHIWDSLGTWRVDEEKDRGAELSHWNLGSFPEQTMFWGTFYEFACFLALLFVFLWVLFLKENKTDKLGHLCDSDD